MFWRLFTRESALTIDKELCNGCGTCVRMCDHQALVLVRSGERVFARLSHPTRCTECGKCIVLCRERAVSLKEGNLKREAFW